MRGKPCRSGRKRIGLRCSYVGVLRREERLGAFGMLARHAFRYELIPTDEQHRDVRRFAASCQFAFNRALAMQKARCEQGEKKLGYPGLCKLLTAWRNRGCQSPLVGRSNPGYRPAARAVMKPAVLVHTLGIVPEIPIEMVCNQVDSKPAKKKARHRHPAIQ